MRHNFHIQDLRDGSLKSSIFLNSQHQGQGFNAQVDNPSIFSFISSITVSFSIFSSVQLIRLSSLLLIVLIGFLPILNLFIRMNLYQYHSRIFCL